MAGGSSAKLLAVFDSEEYLMCRFGREWLPAGTDDLGCCPLARHPGLRGKG
jgi:hypothetical protein